MLLSTVEQVNRLRDRGTINSAGAHELRRHVVRGDEVYFITSETLASVQLTESEVEFCKQQLAKFSWTWVHRPKAAAL